MKWNKCGKAITTETFQVILFIKMFKYYMIIQIDTIHITSC